MECLLTPPHPNTLVYYNTRAVAVESGRQTMSSFQESSPLVPRRVDPTWRHEVVALRLSERDPINQLCGCGKWLSGDMYVSPAMKAVGDGEHEKSQIRRQHVARDTSQPRRVESIIMNAFGLGADQERHS